MAASSSSYNVYIPGDIVPTAATKIKLADRILVSPLGKFDDQFEMICIYSRSFGYMGLG
jgi:hypothetical protein